MAKKYTSINFNHIYDKTGTNNNTNSNTNNNTSRNPSLSSSSSSSSSSSPSYSAVSSQNKHGKILVLTRPTPKPVTHPIHTPSPSLTQQIPDRTRSEPEPDVISLRPLGRTGIPTGSLIPTHVVNNEKDKDVPLISPKTDKFVPPHLRPGYVRRDEGPGPEIIRPRRQGHVEGGGRPKSGGHDRMKRNGGSDIGILGRPGSSGSRPNSSG